MKKPAGTGWFLLTNVKIAYKITLFGIKVLPLTVPAVFRYTLDGFSQSALPFHIIPQRDSFIFLCLFM